MKHKKTPKTPQNKQNPDALQVERAGVLRRIAALVYDTFLIGAIWFALTGLCVILNGGEATPIWFNQFILLPSLLAATFLFYFWFWTHGGQTLGMRAWRLQLLSLEKTEPSLKQAGARFSLALITVGIGFLTAFFHPEKKSLHDIASNTQILLLPKEK